LYAAPSQPNPSCALDLAFRSCVIACVHPTKSLLYVYIDVPLFSLFNYEVVRVLPSGVSFPSYFLVLGVCCARRCWRLGVIILPACVFVACGVSLERCCCSADPIRKVKGARACGLGS
ncbi:unnamed protein product, partial [Ectocarpus fasciculatus]